MHYNTEQCNNCTIIVRLIKNAMRVYKIFKVYYKRFWLAVLNLHFQLIDLYV